MKARLNPLLALILTSGACGVTQAAVATLAPEIHSEVRTMIIDNDGVIDSSHEDAHVILAQGTPGSQKREVRVITSGQNFNMADLPDFPDFNAHISSVMSEAFDGAGSMPMTRNVKNAPYSAEVISEQIRALPDGNQIVRKTSSTAYRDSAGRTRQETRDSKGEVRSIHIHDAVEGSRYVISPTKKSATKISIDKDLQKRIGVIKEKAKTMAKDGKVHIVERSNPGEEIIIKRIESPATEGKKEVREEVKVKVVRASGEPGHPGGVAYSFAEGESIGSSISESMRHGPIGMSFQDMKWSGKSITTQLGTKDFDGVRAEGKNVSYTIPAGEIGNKNPISVSTETWTSPDLQIVIYSKHSDPRVGDSIYRLTNLKRAEPAATLFAVPDGYSVKEISGLTHSTKSK